jgi:Zn-dependent protease
MNVIVIVETFVAFVIAISIHESAHSGMARLLGDTTQDSDGRLTLNPARQLAPIGTLVAGVLSFSYVGLGWGRPVQVDVDRLRGGRDFGSILIAVAGPIANLLIGLSIGAGLHFVPNFERVGKETDPAVGACPLSHLAGQGLEQCLAFLQPAYVLRLEQFAIALAVTSIVIALVNVLPIYPLDGYRVLYALLPEDPALRFRRAEPYMEALLLIIFFVLPILFRFLSLPFPKPSDTIAHFAANIFAGLAGQAYLFYQIL